MRDPAVLAIFAVRVTAEEYASILADAPVVRPFWPPQRCRGCVVGLQVGGEVLGEALLGKVASIAGGASWAFGPVMPYLRRLTAVFVKGTNDKHIAIASCDPIAVVADGKRADRVLRLAA
jgi:hypothetical protein